MPSPLALPPRPAVAPPARWRFPVPRRHRLGNGVTILAHHLPGQHAATMVCHLGVPASAEPDGLDGIAAVMAASLGAGTRGVAARQFEQRAAAAGITWKTEACWTGPVIILELPARQIPAALDLLRLALAEPALDPAQITGQIQLAAAGIARAAASPDTRVLRELPAAVYGDGHRGGRPAGGTLATVTRLTPEAVARFYDDQVRPAATTIVIAGDLAGLDPVARAEEAFATWRDKRPAASGDPQPDPAPRRPPAAVLVNQPGAAQAQLLLAAPVPGRGQPGCNPLQIAARILGAPLTGRLDARVRERFGRSYGLLARLTELIPGHGLLLVTGAVDGPSAPGTLVDIKDILTAPLHDGFTAAEHTAATDAITRTLPLAFETPALLAATTADLAASGLAPDYPDRFLDDSAALTTAAVNGAYKSYLRQGFTLIAAGDAAVLAGPLQKLAGPAPLQVIST